MVIVYRVEAAYVIGGWSRLVGIEALAATVLEGIAASPVSEVRVTIDYQHT